MTILSRLFVLLCVMGLFAAPLSAQTSLETEFDPGQFDQIASQAEDVLESGNASSEALEALRARLTTQRSSALAAKDENRSRVETIAAQINALGPLPEEGETENVEIAERRAELNAQLSTLRAPVLEAEEAHRRAAGLISEIDTVIRERQADALLSLGPSPLFPENWATAWTALGSFWGDVWNEVAQSWQSQVRRVELLNNLPAILALSFVGLGLMLRARRWINVAAVSFLARKQTRTQAIWKFFLSLSTFIVPMTGLLLLTRAIELSNQMNLRGYFFLDALPYAGAAFFGAQWISRNMFVQNQSDFSITLLPEKVILQGRRVVLWMGLLLALNIILDNVAKQADFPIEAQVVLQFPLVLFAGLGLMRIGQILDQLNKQISKADTTTSPLSLRLLTLVSRLCWAIGILGPVLSLVGYSQAGSALVFSTILSLALLGGMLIVFRLLTNFTATLTLHRVKKAGAGESRKAGALFNITLGFAFVCIALPLLALIWGARIYDLTEMWLWLREGVTIGDSRISITDFLTFVLIFSVGYTITRLVQSALRTSVLPNTSLDTGGQNAIATGAGYVGIFLAAFAAISATGLDLSSVAIVAGALSVGIGFGLQTIVSNFVSGIILLVERPIKQGDWIEVSGYSGYVREIKVRATEIETFDRATVVVPNADLIAGTVINWTHRTMSGRVRVPVGVAYGSDPRKVQRILTEIAESHPMVLRNPPPHVVFMGFGADSMDFEIRAILRDVNWMLTAKSDMNFEIVKRFKEEAIEIPFAQRDINLRNVDQIGEAIKDVVSKGKS